MRYYLVPCSTDPAKNPGGCRLAPRFTELLPAASGRPTADPAGKPYYLIEVADDQAGLAAFETQAAVVKLDSAGLTKIKLIALGVDTSKLSAFPTQPELERALVKWLLGEDRALAELFGGP